MPNKENIIMASLITGVYDVNRNHTLENDNISIIKDWANSIINLQLKGIVFHNNFSEETVAQYTNQHLKFIKIAFNKQYNTNVYRYFLYLNYIKQQKRQIKNVFVTDITDVEVVLNPFESKFYQQNNTKLFCGDEQKKLKNDWMDAHGEHFRNTINDYADYELKFKDATLLNCGIIGGEVNLLEGFLEKLCAIHKNYNTNNLTAFTGDMGAFNYLVRTQYEGKVLHGKPCNTVFKEYEVDRNDCWFRHK